jgi:hypothetical protein
MQKLRIVTLGFGTGRQRMALERWTHPKRPRRAWSPRYGLQSCRGKSAGVANGGVRDLPPEIPHVTITIRNFCIDARPSSVAPVGGHPCKNLRHNLKKACPKGVPEISIRTLCLLHVRRGGFSAGAREIVDLVGLSYGRACRAVAGWEQPLPQPTASQLARRLAIRGEGAVR